jgi:GNAT superfamily N-acetyltransferase
VHRAFAELAPRIDPPSSVSQVTPETVARQAEDGEVWLLGSPPVASIFLSIKNDALYIGKLAVDPSARRKGHATRLVAHAEKRARELGLGALELQTRIELVENHQAFESMGFVKVAETAHPGYDRPTSILMRKVL